MKLKKEKTEGDYYIYHHTGEIYLFISHAEDFNTGDKMVVIKNTFTGAVSVMDLDSFQAETKPNSEWDTFPRFKKTGKPKPKALRARFKKENE